MEHEKAISRWFLQEYKRLLDEEQAQKFLMHKRNVLN